MPAICSTAPPEQPVLALPLLTPAQRQASPALLPPKALFAVEQLIHQRFEAQAQAHPQRTALVFGEQTLSYQALNRRANGIAHALLAQGVRPDDRVAILSLRGIDMLCALLGVLKAGAAYVPLDPAYPTERLGYLLDDSAPVALLAQSDCLDALPAHTVPVLRLDELNRADAATDSRLDRNPQAAELGLTPQSTGKPKGTLLPHRNILRLFQATDAWFEFGPQDVWTMFHSYAFDFSVCSPSTSRSGRSSVR